VKIEWDKKKVADGGRVRIVAYDPYVKDNEWTAKASNGNEYTGAEVTSEGFQIFGLNPYQYYSAGIACYVTGNNWMQDSWDNWDNSMDLAGITNRGIVGFKYFGFGGLAQDTKGVKAFEGTKKGDGTCLNLWLTPSGKGAFRIRVMLDGPYANDVHNGREIGVISVAADAAHKPTMFTVEVPEVEGLKGKHAIYLIAEGPEVQQQQRQGRPAAQPERPQGLFDLHGIGFSKHGQTLQRPVVPTVVISVDGKRLHIPSLPIRSTDDNGYTESNRYQTYSPITDTSVIDVVPSDESVDVKIGKIADGRATVICTYCGQKKIYLIN
jgi:hypothetical protein